MSKLSDIAGTVRTFFEEVGMEARKTSWPGRQELFESTVVVIVSVVILGIFVGLCDKVLLTVLEFVIPSAG